MPVPILDAGGAVVSKSRQEKKLATKEEGYLFYSLILLFSTLSSLSILHRAMYIVGHTGNAS